MCFFYPLSIVQSVSNKRNLIEDSVWNTFLLVEAHVENLSLFQGRLLWTRSGKGNSSGFCDKLKTVEARRPLADPTRSKWKLALKSRHSKRMWWHFPVVLKGQVLQLQVSSCMAASRGVAESKITLNRLKTLWIMHRFWWSKQLDPSEHICFRLNVFVYAKGCDHQVISKKIHHLPLVWVTFQNTPFFPSTKKTTLLPTYT